MKSSILIAFVFFFKSALLAQGPIEIQLSNLEGNLMNEDSIYAHRINYFIAGYADIKKYQVSNGVLKFQANTKTGLYYISSEKIKSSTKLFFEKNPHIYHYSMCLKFYEDENYIFISDKFNSKEFKYLKKFYRNRDIKSFDNKLYDNEDNPKRISIERAKNIIAKAKQDYLYELEKKQSSFSQEFTNYINTEIQLGAFNQLLNWYEDIYLEEIQNDVSMGKLPKLFDEINSYRTSIPWSMHSVELYRLIERMVNLEYSLITGVYKTYHDNEDEKQKIRKSSFYEYYYE